MVKSLRGLVMTELEINQECIRWFNMFKIMVTNENTYSLSAEGLANALNQQLDSCIEICENKIKELEEVKPL